MKLANSNKIRAELIAKLYAEFSDTEDCGMITSNSFNFPVVSTDGEEGWVEVVVKVTKDEGDDGYMKRVEYQDKLAAAKARAEAKAAKVAKAKAVKA